MGKKKEVAMKSDSLERFVGWWQDLARVAEMWEGTVLGRKSDGDNNYLIKVMDGTETAVGYTSLSLRYLGAVHVQICV